MAVVRVAIVLGGTYPGGCSPTTIVLN